MRRFLRGFVDGCLSTLGIIIGASAAPGSIVLAAAIGGTLANGLSNFLSAFLAEEAEKYGELREIEKAMVSKQLRGTAVDRRMRRATLIAGSFDGLATVIGGILPVIPFMLAPPSQALVASIVIAFLAVSLVGAYTGRISKRNLVVSGLKMGAFALGVALVVRLIERALVPG